MHYNHLRVFYAFGAVLLVALACNLPLAPAASIPQSPIPAAAVSATIPVMTSTSIPATQPEPVTTTAPTQTAAETATLPVGVFPTETSIPTIEPVFADIMKVTNCRTGPGSHYDLVATFEPGARLRVVARDLGGGFIFVQNPERLEAQCYILANNARLTGEATLLPKYTPPPSPTATPNFKAAFKKFDLCQGNVYAQFVIENTGSVAFRSAYIKVTNLKTNEATEKVVNAFDLTTACVIAKNIAPLDSGATGYLSSEPFKYDPRGNKLKAVIQICTEKGLKGTCVNTILEIKP